MRFSLIFYNFIGFGYVLSENFKILLFKQQYIFKYKVKSKLTLRPVVTTHHSLGQLAVDYYGIKWILLVILFLFLVHEVWLLIHCS